VQFGGDGYGPELRANTAGTQPSQVGVQVGRLLDGDVAAVKLVAGVREHVLTVAPAPTGWDASRVRTSWCQGSWKSAAISQISTG
jgi:hypothetical protein